MFKTESDEIGCAYRRAAGCCERQCNLRALRDRCAVVICLCVCVCVSFHSGCIGEGGGKENKEIKQ